MLLRANCVFQNNKYPANIMDIFTISVKTFDYGMRLMIQTLHTINMENANIDTTLTQDDSNYRFKFQGSY